MPLCIRSSRQRAIRHTLYVLACLLSFPAAAEFRETLAGPEHLDQLLKGGLVVYMRHGRTDARIPDQIPVNPEDCSTQRPLTTEGRRQLDEIGRYVARLDFPFHHIVSSPFCRAVESAERVFQSLVDVDDDLRYTAAMPTAERIPAVARTRYWISQPVSEPRSNRIVVAHGPNIAELMEYLPEEASLTLFRPLGDGRFEYLASIPFRHWPVLMQRMLSDNQP